MGKTFRSVRYLPRTHFYCGHCDRKTWCNELAPQQRQRLCPHCYGRWVNDAALVRTRR